MCGEWLVSVWRVWGVCVMSGAKCAVLIAVACCGAEAQSVTVASPTVVKAPFLPRTHLRGTYSQGILWDPLGSAGIRCKDMDPVCGITSGWFESWSTDPSPA